eukprot:scaffold9388_cov267-Isochrysis_galbana.AAC.1
MPRNELPTPPPPLAYAALIAAQDTELAAACMELQEAERAERMQCATSMSMAEAAHTAQEAARAARMRLGLAADIAGLRAAFAHVARLVPLPGRDRQHSL